MQYSVFHISILIDLLLVKTNLPKERSGLVKILEIVGDKGKDNQDRIDEQFLYKLEDRIKKSIKLEKTEVKIKSTSYIGNCLDYLGYESYEEFVEDLDRVELQVKPLLSLNQEISFQVPLSKKTFLKSLIDSYKVQWGLETYDDKSESCLEKFQHQKAKSFIWFISSNLFQDKADELLKLLKSNSKQNLILFWLTDKGSDINQFQDAVDTDSALKGNEILDDFHLLMQILLRITKGKKKKQKKPLKKIIDIDAPHNRGFVIGELKSKTAPQITNNYYRREDD